jgi:uncharacterized surface protein with fasciclin (FAS1) repeats
MRLDDPRLARITIALAFVVAVLSQFPEDWRTGFALPNYNSSGGGGASAIKELFTDSGVWGTVDGSSKSQPGTIKGTLYDLIQSDPNDYKTLLAVIHAAGMEPTYRGSAPITLFAPDETAFGKLHTDPLSGPLDDAKRAALKEMLRLHTVKGRYPIDKLKDGARLDTIAGTFLIVHISKGTLFVNGVPVVNSNRLARNGSLLTVQTVLASPIS